MPGNPHQTVNSILSAGELEELTQAVLKNQRSNKMMKLLVFMLLGLSIFAVQISVEITLGSIGVALMLLSGLIYSLHKDEHDLNTLFQMEFELRKLPKNVMDGYRDE